MGKRRYNIQISQHVCHVTRNIWRVLKKFLSLLLSGLEVASLLIIALLLVALTNCKDTISMEFVIVFFSLSLVLIPALIFVVVALVRALVRRTLYSYIVLTTIGVMTVWAVILVLLTPKGQKCTIQEMSQNYSNHHQEMQALIDYIQSNLKDDSRILIDTYESRFDTTVEIKTRHKNINGKYSYKDHPNYSKIDSVMQVCGLTKTDYDTIRKMMQTANIKGIEIDRTGEEKTSATSGTYWIKECPVSILYRYAGIGKFYYCYINKNNQYVKTDPDHNVMINDSVMAVTEAGMFTGGSFRTDD